MPTAGPNFSTTTTGNTNTVGGGTRAWTNPNNANAADGVFTTSSLLVATKSDDLNTQGYGFAINSTDTINGITVEVNVQCVNAVNCQDTFIKLLKAGVASGTAKTPHNGLNTTATTITYGSAADLWGTTWTPADINAAGFGVVWTGDNTVGASSDTLSVDFVRITITSTSAAGNTSQAQMFKMF